MNGCASVEYYRDWIRSIVPTKDQYPPPQDGADGGAGVEGAGVDGAGVDGAGVDAGAGVGVGVGVGAIVGVVVVGTGVLVTGRSDAGATTCVTVSSGCLGTKPSKLP